MAGIYSSTEHHPNSVYLAIGIRLSIGSAQESAVMSLKLFTPQSSVQFVVNWLGVRKQKPFASEAKSATLIGTCK